ncbi:uncharacterized protein TNCV_3892781 [Trichonephila clavipes]|nr:uncharacterized protein TNCV_3892781 [Trichonephila clavipes]
MELISVRTNEDKIGYKTIYASENPNLLKQSQISHELLLETRLASSELRCLSLGRKLVVKINCGDWHPPIWCLTKKRYQLPGNVLAQRISPAKKNKRKKKSKSKKTVSDDPGWAINRLQFTDAIPLLHRSGAFACSVSDLGLKRLHLANPNNREGTSLLKRRWEGERSGVSTIKSERKRNEKIGGSVKCGKTCPAFMTSIREQQEAIIITVEYQSVHAGHEMEVKKMQRGSYNPILVYKPVGSALANNLLIKKQDFILCIMTEAQLELLEIYGKNIIMMDSTHGTNQYGYLLTTVMKFPCTVENVSNETTLTIDEDSNHLRREKEREAILIEKEKYAVCEERAELVYKRIRRRMQFINTAASVASTEEMKRLNQCLEDLMKHMGYSEFGSSLRSIENFPANRYIIKQRQKKNYRPLNKQKLANVM